MGTAKKVLRVSNFAHLKPLELALGDLTVFVGPQATGKSLLLQLFKFVLDQGEIARLLKRYGFVWPHKLEALNRLYFGEGFEGIWREETRVIWEGKSQQPLPYQELPERKEKAFYIPAQRALVFQQRSWPRPFDAFREADPFVVRYFSDQVRRFLESLSDGVIFPQERRLQQPIRARLNHTVFRDTSLEIITEGSAKRLMLAIPSGRHLPYLGWSAGQREFIPLLLGASWLLPRGPQPRRALQWVVIEEPEMGLHPAAVESALLLILELMQRGYRVVLSTHSADVLGMMWALQFLHKCDASLARREIRSLFNLKAHPHTDELASTVLSKSTRVYYFQPQGKTVQVQDISSLDAFSENKAIAEWGGITEFATRANEIVARCAATLERQDAL
jgi:energy-coupling factor transporter ATP-binding protein EcfA2